MAVAGPIALSSLLGRELQDEGTLLLAGAPAYVARQDQPGEAAYALVFGQALGRRALMDLLYTLAPYKAHGPDRFPRVLDNWGIFDRALTSPGSMALFQQHARSLKSNWQEFGVHRPLYVAVFEDQSESTRALPVLLWRRDDAGRRSVSFDTALGGLLAAVAESAPEVGADLDGGAQPDGLLGLVCLPYMQPALCRRWPAWKPLVKDGKSNYIGPASVPMMALLHQRALINSALVRAAEESLDAAAV